MQYVVIDLEWNQAISPKSSVFKKLPFHLRGEIIQIGAVRLSEDMYPLDEFKADIKPVYFREVHHKVKKLTGLNKAQLRYGLSFETAIEWMREWCGGDCVLLTWGYDDKSIMEQNLLLHDIDASWILRWVNLQIVYNRRVEGDKNQKSLKTAMEHFEIEQTRIAHDALGDAYNTALICSKLDLKSQISDELLTLRSDNGKNTPLSGGTLYDCCQHPHEYENPAEAFRDKQLTTLLCPACGTDLTAPPLISQGSHRYMTVGRCQKHGAYLLRLKLRKRDTGNWAVTRMLYEADDEMVRNYESKAQAVKKRGKHHVSRYKKLP